MGIASGCVLGSCMLHSKPALAMLGSMDLVGTAALAGKAVGKVLDMVSGDMVSVHILGRKAVGTALGRLHCLDQTQK